MAGLYPHHPLLRRWRCGGEREQRRMPTSGIDLAVAELRTSGGADLSGGGHLRRPPPQLLAGLHLISSSTSVVPSRFLCSLPLLLVRATIAAEVGPWCHGGGCRADGLAERMTYVPRCLTSAGK
ncbi:unnamed protein product [Urochloa humidicola]